MSAVAFKTEFAFTTSPTAPLASQTWTDVSAYVLESTQQTVKRGRPDEGADVSPGTLTLTLDNTDGRFTPGNTAGAYYPNVDLGILVRRTAQVGANSYLRFTGYVDDINVPEWVNSPFHKATVITASDRMARQGSAKAGMLMAGYAYEILGAGASLYWPLEEPEGAAAALPLTTTETDRMDIQPSTGTLTFGSGTGVPVEGKPGVKFTPNFTLPGALGQYNHWLSAYPTVAYTYGTGAPLSLSCFFAVDDTWTAGGSDPAAAGITAADFKVRVIVDMATQRITAEISDLASLTATAAGPSVILGRLYHAVVVAEQGQPLKLYVDDVLYTGGTCPTMTKTATTINAGKPFSGSVSNLAVWRTAVTAANVHDIYTAAMNGMAGLRTDQAMAQVAEYAGIPAAELVATPDGLSRVGAVKLDGRSAAEVMTQIAKIENGVLFVDGSGVFQFHTRAKRYNPAAPAYTFPTAELVGSLSLGYTDQYLINDATVTRTGGATARASDATSITKRGTYAPDPAEVAFYNDNEALDRAQLRVAGYKTPGVRLAALPVSITTSSVQDTLLALDVGALIALTGLTADAPAIGSQWIEGIDESQTIDDYTITFTTSPVLFTGTFFQLGVSALNSGHLLAL